MAPKRPKKQLNQSINPFDDAHPFEAILNSTWDPVKLIEIEFGKMTLHFDNDQQIQSNLSSAIRIKSRKANSSDCINFLKPGIDISVAFGFRNDNDSGIFKPIPQSWVDSKIHSIERKPHKEDDQCSCDFNVNFYSYEHQGLLGTEIKTLQEETMTFDLDQIYILQRLQHNICDGLLEKSNSSEVKPYRWVSSEDCFKSSQSKLMFGKFYSNLSWLVTTSRLNKASFIIKSDQGKIVYQANGDNADIVVPGNCTEIVSGLQHDNDAASCFSDILRVLDSEPSDKSGESSWMVEIVAPDSEQRGMTLFRELKEIFSVSSGVDSFDEATIIKAKSLVEELRPLLLQLPKSSREAFHVFDMFITSLAVNKSLLAAVATHEQAIVSMNEIRQKALALKEEADALHQKRAEKRQKMSTRVTKINELRRQLAKLEQEQLNDIAEDNQITDKLTEGVQQSNPVLEKAIDVKDTLSILSDEKYNKGVLIRGELQALLTDAVPLAST